MQKQLELCTPIQACANMQFGQKVRCFVVRLKRIIACQRARKADDKLNACKL